MNIRWLASLLVFLIAGLGSSVLAGAAQFPQDATFTTLITTPRAIEGLTGDNAGNLYTGGAAITSLGDTFCPVWSINPANSSPSLILVGKLPTPCTPLGIAFNDIGDLFVADGANAKIWTFTPNAGTPPTATTFAIGVPGANGVAFDRDGNLWTSDGVTGQGRVWKITGDGANCTPPNPINCVEVFRIQPMANEVNLVSGVGGVGRDVRALPPGVILVTATTRNAELNTVCPAPFTTPCALGSQPLVANGLAFNKKGDLFNIDTARGALWKIEFDRNGNLKSPTGCDTTFTANTLCLSNVFVAHPILEGGDGIALDKDENIWVDANERNAVAVVTKNGEVFEIFRNPVNLPNPVGFGVGLRNAGDQNGVGNDHILEFPTSPFLTGKLFCTSMSDGNRRDNSPNTGGEIVPGTAILGKISCMDQELKIPDLPLPVR